MTSNCLEENHLLFWASVPLHAASLWYWKALYGQWLLVLQDLAQMLLGLQLSTVFLPGWISELDVPAVFFQSLLGITILPCVVEPLPLCLAPQD